MPFSDDNSAKLNAIHFQLGRLIPFPLDITAMLLTHPTRGYDTKCFFFYKIGRVVSWWIKQNHRCVYNHYKIFHEIQHVHIFCWLITMNFATNEAILVGLCNKKHSRKGINDSHSCRSTMGKYQDIFVIIYSLICMNSRFFYKMTDYTLFVL